MTAYAITTLLNVAPAAPAKPLSLEQATDLIDKAPGDWDSSKIAIEPNKRQEFLRFLIACHKSLRPL